MKKTIYRLCCAVIAAGAVSCSDVLNIESPVNYQESVIWRSGNENLDSYVRGHYGTIRDESQLINLQSNYLDALSDLIKSGDWNAAQRYNRILSQESEIKPEGWSLDPWGRCYGRIKRANEFFTDLKKYQKDFAPEFIDIRIAEMHFIRAFSYFYLARFYGGVVIRDELDGPDKKDKPRASEADTWQFIIDELRKAAEGLPLSWPPEWHGRLTKAAAYGFLSRAALYAGQWEVAADAAEKCEQAGARLDPSYAHVFSDLHSPENLMTFEFFERRIGAFTHNADLQFRPSGDNVTHPGSARVCSWLVPTAEYADAFEMKDGTPFSWETHGDAPYDNRDSRFYASLLFNGAKWEGRTIETFEGGTDGIQKFLHSESASSTVTGYYLKKYITEGDQLWQQEGSRHFDILLRYGEVLLNKAEALAQADWGANRTKALAALNQLRARAGQPAKTAASLEEFMDLIERERIVELGGEGFRYWDLRRWRKAMDRLNGTNAHGCWITKNADGTFSYARINADGNDKRIFKEKYYAFSIPLAERTKNKDMGPNNPGW